MADGSMAIPETFSGRDLGRRILMSLRAHQARELAEFRSEVASLRQAVEQTPSIEIIRGEHDALRAEIAQLRAELAEKSHQEAPPIDPEQIRAMLEGVFVGQMAKWELDFERRAQMILERAIDRMPVPKDGADGKDGGSVEDFGIALEGRMLTVSMLIGGQVKSKTERLDIPQDRGIWQAKAYEKSDIVTFSGSQFIATRDTLPNEQPEKSSAWRLCVKRGRDGRDAE